MDNITEPARTARLPHPAHCLPWCGDCGHYDADPPGALVHRGPADTVKVYERAGRWSTRPHGPPSGTRLPGGLAPTRGPGTALRRGQRRRRQRLAAVPESSSHVAGVEAPERSVRQPGRSSAGAHCETLRGAGPHTARRPGQRVAARRSWSRHACRVTALSFSSVRPTRLPTNRLARTAGRAEGPRRCCGSQTRRRSR